MKKAEAENEAAFLVEALGGAPWKARTWENLGWHSEASMDFEDGGFASVRLLKGGIYSAAIRLGKSAGAFSDTNPDTLRAQLAFFAHGATAKDAVSIAWAMAKLEALSIRRAFDRADLALVQTGLGAKKSAHVARLLSNG